MTRILNIRKTTQLAKLLSASKMHVLHYCILEAYNTKGKTKTRVDSLVWFHIRLFIPLVVFPTDSAVNIQRQELHCHQCMALEHFARGTPSAGHWTCTNVVYTKITAMTRAKNKMLSYH